MSTLVDTNALRELSTWLYDESQNDKSLLAGVAADEVDRLRRECDHYGPYPLLPSAKMQVDRLRAVIENAPHGDDCWLREDPDEGVLPEHRTCTCWKAGAL